MTKHQHQNWFYNTAGLMSKWSILLLALVLQYTKVVSALKIPEALQRILLRIAAVCLPHWAAFRAVYFIDRSSGSDRQRLCYFIKTVFSSSTGHREYCQVTESSTTSAEWVEFLWHNKGRRNNNTNACIRTLHSYFRAMLQLLHEETDEPSNCFPNMSYPRFQILWSKVKNLTI